MPNMLSSLIDPKYSTTGYPGREKLLSQVAGQGFARPATPIQAPIPSVRPQPQEPAWQRAAKEHEAKQSVQKALNEIITARNKTGKKFLNPTERLGILTKYVSPQIANQINSTITAEQTKAEPKYRDVSWIDPKTGMAMSGMKTEEELRKPRVVKKPSWKEEQIRLIESGEKTFKDYPPLQQRLLGVKPEITPKQKMEIFKEKEEFKAGLKRKDPKYDLKKITEFMDKNSFYDEDLDAVVLPTEFADAAKDMLGKSDAKNVYEIIPVEISTKKGWFKDVPGETTWKLQKKETATTEDPAKTIVNTGVIDGRKVIKYSDGTIEYAK